MAFALCLVLSPNSAAQVVGTPYIPMANPCAVLPTAPTGSDVSRCGAGTVNLSVSGAGAGESYRWYSSASSETPLASGATYNPNISATTNYYVAKYNITTDCETAANQRLKITATVNPVPSAGTISGGTLLITGSTLQLSNTVAGGNWSSSSPAVATINSAGLVEGIAAGTATITYTVTGTGGCTNTTTHTVTVVSIPSTPGGGSLSGKVCFDIAENNSGGNCGEISDRMVNKVDFTTQNVHTYTFTKGTGTVQNVSYVIQDPEGVLAPSQALSGELHNGVMSAGSRSLTLTFKTDLNSPNAVPKIYERTRNQAAKVIIHIIYNNGTTDVSLSLTLSIQDCACCGAYIASGVWRAFMCHNLGANESLDPFTPAIGLHGAHYQWGRKDPVATAPTSSQPNGAIIGTWSDAIPAGYFGDNTNSGTITKKSEYDPCPNGYRVPSSTEWSGVYAYNTRTNKGGSWTSGSAATSGAMFGPALLIPTALERGAGGTAYYYNRGTYWVNTKVDATYAGSPSIDRNDGLNWGHSGRYMGYVIRCIAEK